MRKVPVLRTSAHHHNSSRSFFSDNWFSIIGGHLVVNNYQQGDPNQLWEHADPVIRNRQQPNKVLDISGKHV